MDLFNAAVVDSPDVRYASIVTAAPPPPWELLSRDLLSVARAVLAGSFALLYAIASREHRQYRYPHPGEQVLETFAHALPFPLTPSSNDGIVPAFSQVYGDVLDVVVADHLDIVGQFRRPGVPYSDWLPSGSCFDVAAFDRAWDGVAAHIAGVAAEATSSATAAAGGEPPPRT
jgi:hypothetical protein